MAHRRKKSGGHANHERWIVSYADFVTLLFAFFVVMFATANEKGKNRAVSESVRAALEEGQMSRVGDAIAKALTGKGTSAGPSQAKPKDPSGKATFDPQLQPVMEVLKKQLQPVVQKGEVEIHMEPRGLAISFRQAALFDSGQDRLKPSAYDAISKVADAIQRLPNQVRLEGHTDDVPIHNDRFRSNWELSAARSISVLALLTVRFHVPPERLGIAGYAFGVPVASNSTEEGRARNRRVDVVILTERAARDEPPGKLNPTVRSAGSPK